MELTPDNCLAEGSCACGTSETASSHINGSTKANFIVDFHSHLLPRTVPDFAARYGYGGFINIDHDQTKVSVPGNARMLRDGKLYREISPSYWDLEARVEEMDRDGINVQVVSCFPVMFSYWAKADDTADLCRILNNDMARQIARYPKRFIGLGTVPMQAPELAIDELNRCIKELGFAGVHIASHVNDWNLDTPELMPFWEAAEELNACIFVHPWDMKVGRREKKYMMPHLVGMPAETTQAVVSFMLGGILDKFPRLKICFAHGAGSFPYTFGRINHAYYAKPDICASDSPDPPEHYLRRFMADSLVYDPRSLKLLIDVIGENNVVFGTDYPGPLAECVGAAKGIYPGKILDEADLSLEARQKILSGNALRFLGKKIEDYF